MGSGAARELTVTPVPEKPLDPKLSARLAAAVQKLDRMDADFAQAREDERLSQLAKDWGGVCAQIDGYLRTVGLVLIKSHQISLDIGSEGGGRAQTPFIEETAGKWRRLEFKCMDDGSVQGLTQGRVVGRATIPELDYDFFERVVVDWIIGSIELLQQR